MMIKPPHQDLLRLQPQKVIDHLSLLTKGRQLWTQLNVQMCQQTPPDDLPNQPMNQVLPPFYNIARADIHHRTPNVFRSRNSDVNVVGILKDVEFTACRFVENSCIDCARYGIVDQLTQDEPVFTFVKKLHRVCWDWETVPNMWIVFDHLNNTINSPTCA